MYWPPKAHTYVLYATSTSPAAGPTSYPDLRHFRHVRDLCRQWCNRVRQRHPARTNLERDPVRSVCVFSDSDRYSLIPNGTRCAVATIHFISSYTAAEQRAYRLTFLSTTTGILLTANTAASPSRLRRSLDVFPAGGPRQRVNVPSWCSAIPTWSGATSAPQDARTPSRATVSSFLTCRAPAAIISINTPILGVIIDRQASTCTSPPLRPSRRAQRPR